MEPPLSRPDAFNYPRGRGKIKYVSGSEIYSSCRITRLAQLQMGRQSQFSQVGKALGRPHPHVNPVNLPPSSTGKTIRGRSIGMGNYIRAMTQDLGCSDWLTSVTISLFILILLGDIPFSRRNIFHGLSSFHYDAWVMVDSSAVPIQQISSLYLYINLKWLFPDWLMEDIKESSCSTFLHLPHFCDIGCWLLRPHPPLSPVLFSLVLNCW